MCRLSKTVCQLGAVRFFVCFVRLDNFSLIWRPGCCYFTRPKQWVCYDIIFYCPCYHLSNDDLTAARYVKNYREYITINFWNDGYILNKKFCTLLAIFDLCGFFLTSSNMSYGATVGASAANSNLVKFKKIFFYIITPVLNKSYVHCDFSKLFIDYLNIANEFKLFVCCCWYLVFTLISGPATVQNQNLWSAYMYIYCHVVNF